MDVEELEEFVKVNKYLVVNQEGVPFLFSSLREMEKDINIDYSTISKYLTHHNNSYIFQCKSDEILYYIKKF